MPDPTTTPVPTIDTSTLSGKLSALIQSMLNQKLPDQPAPKPAPPPPPAPLSDLTAQDLRGIVTSSPIGRLERAAQAVRHPGDTMSAIEDWLLQKMGMASTPPPQGK